MILINHCRDKHRDYDFLSSIEVVILDQADVYLMQNWDHLQILFENMNLIPQKPRSTDFSRVRTWYLNKWAKFYRQTLIFTALLTAEINALFHRFCYSKFSITKKKTLIMMITRTF
jgi:U3 small nucleolar RNA-associated protein 25